MNITITGNLGSGKSTVCTEFQKENYKVISAGDIFRQIAKEEKMSVLELNKKIQEDIKHGDRSIDDKIDSLTHEMGNLYQDAVFDSRLAWHFVEKSFKVFLTVDISEAAQRVLNADRDTERYVDLNECKRDLLQRQLIEQERFAELYNLHYYDMNNYNLIIETTSASPEQIMNAIKEQLKEYENGKFTQRILLNPTSIYPTQNTRDLSEETLNRYINDKNMANYGLLRVGVKNNEWYVLDGHHRLLAAMVNKQPFIYVSNDIAEYQGEVERSAIYDFEDITGMQYKHYPAESRSKNLLNFFAEKKTLNCIPVPNCMLFEEGEIEEEEEIER